MNWYSIKNIEMADSPSLLIYRERVEGNIDKMIEIAGDVQRLFTHVKTNKMVEVVELMIQKGIYQFKCATIAEAEMTAIAIENSGVQANFHVVVAHQLVSPKILRLVQLKKKFPQIKFSSLLDSHQISTETNQIFAENDAIAHVFIDINNGMNRSGHLLNQELLGLYEYISQLSNIKIEGLHVYDGHIRVADFEERKQQIDDDFVDVKHFIEVLQEKGLEKPIIIAGGTPAFTAHALRNETFCSPGTCVLWDWGYGDKLTEQPFQYAALVATRIISKPNVGLLTIDMGHKAVGAENPIDKRIRFLNLTDYELLSQSEEHGVVKVADWENWQVGDVLYGVPYHVCPTVNLYDEAYWIENQVITKSVQVLGRKRKISI